MSAHVAETCHDGACVTCGDVAIPMRVVRVDVERGLALCEDAAGARSSVETALVGEVRGGAGLLVHAGVALAHLGDGVDLDAGELERTEATA